MQDPIVKKYVQLLEHVSGMNVSDLTVTILPASKSTLLQKLNEEYYQSQSDSEKSMLTKATSLLSSFADDPRSPSALFASLIGTPFALSLIYSIWLGFRSDGWHWVAVSIISFVTSAVCLLIRMPANRVGVGYNIILSMSRTIFLISYAAIWIRWIIISGLWGGWTSLTSGPNWVGILLAMLALVVGWHYSKALNRLHFFVFDNVYGGAANVELGGAA